jgi:outer membrane protein TolC
MATDPQMLRAEQRRERFPAERATTVELTEAQTELLNARLQAVGAQVAIRRARARILYVVGSEHPVASRAQLQSLGSSRL